MDALTSSGVSRHSNFLARRWDIAVVSCALVLSVALAAWWCFSNGYILYYGDAQAHLDLSRGLIDSRTPGYDQLGTVWLPVLHVLCLPLVGNDWLWSTGLAGTIPVAGCFVVAGSFFYLSAREAYANRAAAAISVACLVLNPNVLYLATIPMTEQVFLAGLAVLLFALLRFGATRKRRFLILGVAASWSMSLTRYDGWFLIPFTGLWFALVASRRKLPVLFVFGAAASLAPLYWVGHNWWETGNALDFYNGPYSAAAIQGGKPYPGSHDWPAAIHYYLKAGELCAGWVLALLGIVGAICAILRLAYQPVLFLFLTPLFYIWSVHSSGGSPIYLPGLWPYSYYNSRYGLAVVVFCAFSAGAIALVLPPRFRKAPLLIPLFAILPWVVHPSKENWICWKESQVNSVSRRAWTAKAARYLAANYRPGQGILTSAGDAASIYCRARIHLSETLNIDNGPAWFAASTRPDLFHPNLWAVSQRGDCLYKTIHQVRSPPYRPVLQIATKDNPVLEISERTLP